MCVIGFIGAGNMATAIIQGYLNHPGGAKADIVVFDIAKQKSDALTHLGVRIAESAVAVAEQADYLVLSVKPQSITEVLTQLQGHISKATVIISIAAGISGCYIQSMLSCETKVVLVMPNTPLLLGKGATALACVAPTSQKEFEFVCQMFGCCGSIAVIPADKMNEIIPINGSAPAFIYEFARHFIGYAKQVGLDEKTARSLFAQTLIGAGEMMQHSGDDINTLVEMVSSRGGTTIAGLEVLRLQQLEQIVHQACAACTKRAYELSAQ